jgi:4-diphosphocytidyl-2-C-methyl-D-erythritol kinase
LPLFYRPAIYASMKILSPAKINLFLKVLKKRPDGYHDIFSLMCPVGLFDSIRFDFTGHGICVSCDHPDVPEDETNLAFRAASLFFEKLDDRPSGLLMKIDKSIPVAAGLGGGSSNAATVLKVLNNYYGNPFSLEQLQKIGLAIGADVPFFILSKPALVRGIGEKLRVYAGLVDHKVILIYPDIKISTAQVYKNLNLGLTNCKKKPKYPIFKNRNFDFRNNLYNDLEAIATSWHPEILELKNALVHNGADAVLMSGSGPTVFGLYKSTDQAYKIVDKLSENKSWKVFLTNLLL